MIKDKVREFAESRGMLPAGGRVLCACSGGADSVCLLHLLCSMEDVTVVCAHFNHGLRGGESDRDEGFVRELCAALGVECVTDRGDEVDLAYPAEGQDLLTMTEGEASRFNPDGIGMGRSNPDDSNEKFSMSHVTFLISLCSDLSSSLVGSSSVIFS